jgi:hypothetical protein
VQVDLLCPILLIAADTPAADKLCGHFSSYSEGVKHLTCSCDVSFSDSKNPNFICHSVTWVDELERVRNQWWSGSVGSVQILHREKSWHVYL